jgi:uncharacterized protein (DUF2147 family)
MRTLITASLIAAVLAAPLAWAQEGSPVGLWKTIDDSSGKPTALIRITENHGELQGKIEKLFRAADEEQNPKCKLCTDARKTGDEYSGGEILDPKNGKVYKSKLTVREGGKKVEVRGFIGMPMFGRSQVWLRQE